MDSDVPYGQGIRIEGLAGSIGCPNGDLWGSFPFHTGNAQAIGLIMNLGSGDWSGPLELDYYIVDVFTKTAFEGNALAVVMNTANLTTERMQTIAREFNLSETTFVERREA